MIAAFSREEVEGKRSCLRTVPGTGSFPSSAKAMVSVISPNIASSTFPGLSKFTLTRIWGRRQIAWGAATRAAPMISRPFRSKRRAASWSATPELNPPYDRIGSAREPHFALGRGRTEIASCMCTCK